MLVVKSRHAQKIKSGADRNFVLFYQRMLNRGDHDLELLFKLIAEGFAIALPL